MPPFGNFAMVAAQQNIRDPSPVPFHRVGILRIFQQSVPVALLGKALLAGQYTLHHPADAIHQYQRPQLAAGQHIVPYGKLLIHDLIQHPLVHTLIVAAQQEEVFLLLQLPGMGLGQHLALR